jgi:CxxC motif-containing protein
MKKIQMPCIVCPMSCQINVVTNAKNEILSISGNNCPKGNHYVRNELLHPVRLLTSTVAINNALYKRCPVMTSNEIPKDKMFDVMEIIKTIEIDAPINIGTVIVKNVCDLNVDVVVTRSLEKVR